MGRSALIAALSHALGTGQVLTGADALPYAQDWRGRYRGEPVCVARPADVGQVAETVRLCAQAGVAIVPQGGNTGLCGGATAHAGQGEVVVSLSRLNRIVGIDRDNATLTAQAGCTLASIQQAARQAGLLFPLSLASEGSCQIGGNLSTNAGGVQVLRYGNARELTLGLEVVLPDGRIWSALRGLRKDNTGYDLKQLFIGAEGTLGIITAATLKLFPLPRAQAVAWVAVPDPHAALALLRHMQRQCVDVLQAFELVGRPAFDMVLRHIPGSSDPLRAPWAWAVLIELAGAECDAPLLARMESALAAAMQAGWVDDAVIAADLTRIERLWVLRESISEAQRIEGFSIKHDISVPVSRVPEFIDRAHQALSEAFPDLRIVVFGHLGDGNLHFNPSFPDAQRNASLVADPEPVTRCVYDLVSQLGGSFSAEHGVGQLKRTELARYKSEVELDLMRALKRTFDPSNLMNPGKLLA